MSEITSPITKAAAHVDVDALQAVARAATPGPWHWAGNTDTGEPYLATWIKGAGRCQVLSIGYDERSTTGREADQIRADARECDLGDPEELVETWAYDAFGQPNRDPRLEFMTDLMLVNARDLAIYEVAPNATSREDPAVYRADITGIRHPDAKFIAAASPEAVLALIEQLRAAEQRIQHATEWLEENRPVKCSASSPADHDDAATLLSILAGSDSADRTAA